MTYDAEALATIALTIIYEGTAANAERHLARVLRDRRPLTFAGDAIPLGNGVVLGPHLWADPHSVKLIIPF